MIMLFLLSTPRAPSTAAEGACGLIVADGYEVLEDLVADVSPLLEHFLSRRPILGANLAGAEDMAATPASLDVFDAFVQPDVFGAFLIDAAHLRSIGGDVTTAAALGMTQHDEKAAGDVDVPLPPFFLGGLLQDRQIVVFRRGCDHACQGWDLTELDRVDVLECVEIDDH